MGTSGEEWRDASDADNEDDEGSEGIYRSLSASVAAAAREPFYDVALVEVRGTLYLAIPVFLRTGGMLMALPGHAARAPIDRVQVASAQDDGSRDPARLTDRCVLLGHRRGALRRVQYDPSSCSASDGAQLTGNVQWQCTK
jgi:hypothetical protein